MFSNDKDEAEKEHNAYMSGFAGGFAPPFGASAGEFAAYELAKRLRESAQPPETPKPKYTETPKPTYYEQSHQPQVATQQQKSEHIKSERIKLTAYSGTPYLPDVDSHRPQRPPEPLKKRGIFSKIFSKKFMLFAGLVAGSVFFYNNPDKVADWTKNSFTHLKTQVVSAVDEIRAVNDSQAVASIEASTSEAQLANTTKPVKPAAKNSGQAYAPFDSQYPGLQNVTVQNYLDYAADKIYMHQAFNLGVDKASFLGIRRAQYRDALVGYNNGFIHYNSLAQEGMDFAACLLQQSAYKVALADTPNFRRAVTEAMTEGKKLGYKPNLSNCIKL